MAKVESVAALCLEPGGRRLLMVLQGKPGAPPTWTVPGGALAETEPPEETVAREVREEAGLKVEVEGLFHTEEATTVDRFKQEHEHVVHYYAVKATDKALRPNDPDGRIYRADWVLLDQFDALGFSVPFEEAVLRRFVEERT